MNTPFDLPDNPDSACRPPSARDVLVDRTFRALARIGVVLVLALVFALVYEVGRKALPGIEKHGREHPASEWPALPKAQNGRLRLRG